MDRMAETPKQDIEKLLSDYAKQRRDAAGTPELHPATRGMLQGEVRRQYGSVGEQTRLKPSASRWSLLWPRIATACGVLAAIATVFFLINPSGRDSEPMRMALSDEPTSRPEAAATLAPTRAMSKEGPTAELPAEAREEQAKNELADKDLKAGALAAPPPAITTRTTDEVTSRRSDQVVTLAGGADRNEPGAGGTRGSFGGQMPLKAAQTPVPTSAAPPVMDVAAAGVSAESTARSFKMAKAPAQSQPVTQDMFLNSASTQRYRNVAVAPNRAEASPVVLEEFTMEQNGNALKVVDRDGSVYNGYVQAAPLDPAALTNVSNFVAAQGQAVTANQAIPVGQTVSQAPGGQGFQATQAETATVAQGQNASVAQNYYFRVEGTNRSLRENVVFSGNLFNTPLANSAVNDAANVQQRFRQQSQLQQIPDGSNYNQQLQYNNFINGRVMLGNSRQSTELNALSVEE